MRITYWLVAITILLIGIILIHLLFPAGVFKAINPHFKGNKLTIYHSVYGPEDIALDQDNGLAFISSTARRSSNTDSSTDGIYILDLNNTSDQPRLLPNNLKDELHPHGISFLSLDSSNYIFIVNHNDSGDFIELFRFRNDSLLLESRFQDKLMVSPNDVIGISTTEFYITNDHSSKESSQDIKEDYLRLNNRNIVHFKDGIYTEAATSLAMPNGINVSHDQQVLYCATTLGQELVSYKRNTITGALKEYDRTKLHSGLDNISIDAEGSLWIGSHPKLFDFVAHANTPANFSPSQVFKLDPLPNHSGFTVEEIYLDDGSNLSGSSVAVRYKNDLLIGVVFENKIFRGQLDM